jgi:hypothetical protein
MERPQFLLQDEKIILTPLSTWGYWKEVMYTKAPYETNKNPTCEELEYSVSAEV